MHSKIIELSTKRLSKEELSKELSLYDDSLIEENTDYWNQIDDEEEKKDAVEELKAMLNGFATVDPKNLTVKVKDFSKAQSALNAWFSDEITKVLNELDENGNPDPELLRDQLKRFEDNYLLFVVSDEKGHCSYLSADFVYELSQRHFGKVLHIGRILDYHW